MPHVKFAAGIQLKWETCIGPFILRSTPIHMAAGRYIIQDKCAVFFPVVAIVADEGGNKIIQIFLRAFQGLTRQPYIICKQGKKSNSSLGTTYCLILKNVNYYVYNIFIYCCRKVCVNWLPIVQTLNY